VYSLATSAATSPGQRKGTMFRYREAKIDAHTGFGLVLLLTVTFLSLIVHSQLLYAELPLLRATEERNEIRPSTVNGSCTP
jgi:hypothetical protein